MHKHLQLNFSTKGHYTQHLEDEVKREKKKFPPKKKYAFNFVTTVPWRQFVLKERTAWVYNVFCYVCDTSMHQFRVVLDWFPNAIK